MKISPEIAPLMEQIRVFAGESPNDAEYLDENKSLQIR